MVPAASRLTRGFWPGEWQLDLDQLLAGLGDIVHFVDP
jgi:hypothetical protein